MKTSLNFLFVLFIISIFSSGCEKDNPDPDKNQLRISKIADNISMENPWWVFNYNADGLVVNIESFWGDDILIEYNSDNLPIKVDRDITIEWNDIGFTITEKNDYFGNKNIYVLDSKDRIKKITSIWEYQSSNPDTSITELEWIGLDSLYIDKYSEGFKHNNIHYPLSNINLALLTAAEIALGEWEMVYQNEFSLDEWKSQSLNCIIDYELNEQGYPNRAELNYSDYSPEYLYFEYELN